MRIFIINLILLLSSISYAQIINGSFENMLNNNNVTGAAQFKDLVNGWARGNQEGTPDLYSRNSSGTRDTFQYSNDTLVIKNFNPHTTNNSIVLFPTATSSVFNLKSSILNIEKVELIDNNGKIVKTENKSFKESEVNCNELIGGFYLVKLYLTNGSVVFKKIVKID